MASSLAIHLHLDGASMHRYWGCHLHCFQGWQADPKQSLRVIQCQRLCQCKSHAQIVCRLAQHVGHADPGGPPSRNSAPVHQLSNTITTTLQCSSTLHARALMRHHNQTRCAEQPMANAETLAYAVFRQRSLQGERADFGKALLTSNTLALSYNNQGAWSKA